jgi:hypothetical protein
MDVKNTQMPIIGMLAKVTNKIEETKSGKTFSFCEVLIDTGREKNPLFCIKAKTNDPLITGRVGDKVEAVCWINCREWNGKYFYSVDLAQMKLLESPVEAVDGETVAQSIEEKANQAMGGESENLPF